MAKVFLVTRPYEADIIAFRTSDPEAADLHAFIGKQGALARGDTHWFIVSNIFYASCKLMWTESEDDAALKVHVVSDPADARWVRDHPLKGQL